MRCAETERMAPIIKRREAGTVGEGGQLLQCGVLSRRRRWNEYAFRQIAAKRSIWLTAVSDQRLPGEVRLPHVHR